MDSLWGLSIFYIHHVRGKTKRKDFSFREKLRGHKSFQRLTTVCYQVFLKNNSNMFVDPVVFRPET